MEQFSIGRVFSRAFGLIRDSAASVGLFILSLLVIEAVVGLLVQPMLLENLKGLPVDPGAIEVGANPALNLFQSIWYWISTLIGIAALGLAWAGGVHGLLQQAWKGSCTLAECFQVGITRFLPVLGLIILWWLGFMLGWLLLVVPATILVSMWAVAVPAQVGEGLGVFAAFGRSRALTRGHRLSIFGVLFLMVIVYYVLMIVVVGSMLGVGSLVGNLSMDGIAEASMWMMLASIPIGWVTGMLLKAVVVSLYLETVLVKEGARTDHLSDVFE